jgi:hypothetical protein
MASHNATDLYTKNAHLGEFGNAVVYWGAVTPTAGALADVYRPVRIPGGAEITDLIINFPDMDTGGTAFAVKIGYEPVNSADGPVASDAYFSAATTVLSGNTKELRCVFRPIKFERPVFVTMTVTVAATTFVSGEIVAKAYGDNVGIK